MQCTISDLQVQVMFLYVCMYRITCTKGDLSLLNPRPIALIILDPHAMSQKKRVALILEVPVCTLIVGAYKAQLKMGSSSKLNQW